MVESSTPDVLPTDTVPDIDRCIQTAMFDKTFSGAACIASVGGRIFHRAIYGNPTHPPPIKKLPMNALFDLASLTKPLGAGLAAMVLSSQNRLDLNASVGKTLPELRTERFTPIAIDMLLDHTSGLPAFRSYWERIKELDANKVEAHRILGTKKAIPLIKKMVAETPLEYDPGMKTVYSDIGFMILGWIIEHVTGKSLDVFLAHEVYRPLGIQNDLFFVRLDEPRERQRLMRRIFAATSEGDFRQKLIQGEVHDPNAWAMGGVAGHAGLFGTADAVWRLVFALWDSYAGTGRHFLGGSVRRFWTRSKRLADTTRTLAWDTPSAIESQAGKRFSKNSVGHLGFTGCSIWLDLSTDVIGVVLTNAVHPTIEKKEEALKKFRQRLYEIIAKHGEALPPDPKKATGSRAFYDGPIAGPTTPLYNPLKTPGKN